MVLLGTLLRPTIRVRGPALLTIGALAGTNATVWTLIVPILAIITVVAAYRDRGPAGGCEIDLHEAQAISGM